jgi:hypothetical protein
VWGQSFSVYIIYFFISKAYSLKIIIIKKKKNHVCMTSTSG